MTRERQPLHVLNDENVGLIVLNGYDSTRNAVTVISIPLAEPTHRERLARRRRPQQIYTPSTPESQWMSDQIPGKDSQPVLSVGLDRGIPVVQPQNLKPGAFQPKTRPTSPTEQVKSLHRRC